MTEAKSRLGWYYEVCTDHEGGRFKKDDFKNFAFVAASLMKVDMSIEDAANQNMYKAQPNTRNGGTLISSPTSRF